jgi:hypothetical protein
VACNCIPAYCPGATDFAAEPECIAWRTTHCGLPEYPWQDCAPSQILTLEQQVAAHQVSSCFFPNLQPHERARFDPVKGCVRECDPGFHYGGFGYGTEAICIKDFTDKFDAGEFFTNVGIGAAELASVLAAPYLAPETFAAGAAYTATVAGQILKGNEVQTMGLDFGTILQGVGQIGGGFESGDYLSALSGAANIASGFLAAPAPTYAAGPVYGIMPQAPPPMIPQAQPVMSTAPIIASAGSAIARVVAPILGKLAAKIGVKSLSLTKAIALIKRMSKFLKDPAVIATALGITTAELATLIVSHNARKRRHMNPANSRALRRAARRIRSFHRMCGHIDLLKSRGRRHSYSSRCMTCKKSPCRC